MSSILHYLCSVETEQCNNSLYWMQKTLQVARSISTGVKEIFDINLPSSLDKFVGTGHLWYLVVPQHRDSEQINP